MKINTFYENTQELTTQKDIKQYLKDNFGYHGNVVLEDGSVILDNDLYIAHVQNDKLILPFTIKECQTFKYYGCTLNEKNSQPIECESFKLENCSVFTPNLDVNTLATEYAISHTSFSYGITIRNTNNHLTDLTFRDSNIQKIKYISPYTSVRAQIMLCKNIRSFKDISLGSHVNNYEIRGIGARDFKGFDTIVNNYLVISSNSFDNYLLTDTLHAKLLDIVIDENYNNLITVVLNKHCKDITLYISHNQKVNSDSDMVVKIINKYVSFDKNERSDQIMDCALELIEAGFEKAAEL